MIMKRTTVFHICLCQIAVARAFKTPGPLGARPLPCLLSAIFCGIENRVPIDRAAEFLCRDPDRFYRYNQSQHPIKNERSCATTITINKSGGGATQYSFLKKYINNQDPR